MEEKILQMEAEADVLGTPYRPSASAGSYISPADAEKQLRVEEQLNALKSKLTPPAKTGTTTSKE
ncbi:hypothetical protein D3C81_2082830 [compost metagenome]